MQFLKSGDKSVLLDGTELYTLDKAVDTLAICVFDDYLALKRGVENSNGKNVSEETLNQILQNKEKR